MIGFGMHINRWYYIPVYAIFVLCALIRLAYYDVTEELRMSAEGEKRRTYYEGLARHQRRVCPARILSCRREVRAAYDRQKSDDAVRLSDYRLPVRASL